MHELIDWLPQWLRVAQVARRLGVSREVVYGLLQRGELPAWRFGKLYKVRLIDLLVFMDRSRVAPAEK